MRCTRRGLDKCRIPSKYYKYGYQADPRKNIRAESGTAKEIFPRVRRGATAMMPSVERFLEYQDYRKGIPYGEYASNFSSFHFMYKASKQFLYRLGFDAYMERYLRRSLHMYTTGHIPWRFDQKQEEEYWKEQQKRDVDRARCRVPELPKFYRPHQQGVEQRPILNYEAMNLKPDWAIKEEERLKLQRQAVSK